MIRRTCPSCGKDWYSAVTSPWQCDDCGEVIDDENNKPLLSAQETEEKESARAKPGKNCLSPCSSSSDF